jgi:CDP-diacylglycerol--inositol 3-phosphatidyltransferase
MGGCVAIAGYTRVALLVYAFAVSLQSPVQTIVFYFLSFACDDLDGRFARALNQTSTLGAVLDMVTDRSGGDG